jgi:hypothetical protein
MKSEHHDQMIPFVRNLLDLVMMEQEDRVDHVEMMISVHFAQSGLQLRKLDLHEASAGMVLAAATKS